MNRSPEICQQSDRRVMKNEMLRCVRLLRSAINSTPGIEIRSVMELLKNDGLQSSLFKG